MHPRKTCTRCGGSYREDVFFRHDSNANRHTRVTVRAICIGCEQKARDAEKQRNRFPAKARAAISSHARKFVKKGILQVAEELTTVFGWDPKALAHDFEFAYNNGCAYCRRKYSTMGHGLSDLTIDILDPDALPYYSTNTKLCCSTCNKEKGQTPPHLWAAKLIEWAKWEARQIFLAGKEWIGPLFDWTKD